jgi:hypothetical protein
METLSIDDLKMNNDYSGGINEWRDSGFPIKK